MKSDTTKGVEALKTWCATKGVTPSKFAISIGRDPSVLRRVLQGKRAPSLELAFAIQNGTGGEVPITVWGIWTSVDGTVLRTPETGGTP